MQQRPIYSSERSSSYTLLTIACILLGIGTAGFFDGIVLHELLQWHHMVTAIRPPVNLANLSANTFWDGMFHLGSAVISIAGVGVLWRAVQQGQIPAAGPVRSRLIYGSLLLGFGAFNLIEGLVDHHLLGIHHVKTNAVHLMAWDLGFLGINLGVAIAGGLLWRSSLKGENGG